MPGQQAVGGVEMQPFDHAVADANRALALGFGGGERSRDAIMPRHQRGMTPRGPGGTGWSLAAIRASTRSSASQGQPVGLTYIG